MDAGLPPSSVPSLLAALESAKQTTVASVPGANDSIIAAAAAESRSQFTYAYRAAWGSIIPFVALSIVAVLCLGSVKDLMTEEIDATVERNVDKQANVGAGGAVRV